MDLFSMDAPWVQKLGLLFDLMVLSLLTVLLCLPVVTAGAAITALYDGVWRLKHNRGSLLKDYWRTFRSNFLQSTAIWLILLLTAFLLGYNVLLFFGGQEGMGLMVIPMVLGAAVWIILSAWVFILQSRFHNTVGQTLINALLCGLKYLPRTLGIVALNMLPLAVLFLEPERTWGAGLLLVFFWLGLSAYWNICLLDVPLLILGGPENEEKLS